VQKDPETSLEDGLLQKLRGESTGSQSIDIAPALRAKDDEGNDGPPEPRVGVREQLRRQQSATGRGWPAAPSRAAVAAEDSPTVELDADGQPGLGDPNNSYIPRIFYTNSSYEYWGRAASLTHTRLDGRRDFNLHPNTRFYLFSGTQHQPAPWPPVHTQGKHLANPNDFHPAMRALLVRLDRWVKGQQDPPDNRIPQIRGRALVAPDRLRWPQMPDAPLLTGVQKAYRVDYGSRFQKDGIVDNEPPKVGSEFPVLVPQVDADGNEIAGVRMPAIAVPLATYTGWNPFREGQGPETEISSMVGSFIPLPRTREEARARGDRRRPISDRYQSREEYLGRVNAAAQQLAGEGFLLQHDIPGILQRAEQTWDWIMQQP